MSVYGPVISCIVITLHQGKQLITAVNPPGSFQQDFEQAELIWSQIDRVLLNQDLPGFRIEPDGSALEPRTVCDSLSASALDSFDPSDHFTWAEGFADVIIRTQFQSQHPVYFFCFGSDHDDRDIAETSQFAADIDA